MAKKKSKKKYIVIGIILLVIVVGYFWLKDVGQKTLTEYANSMIVETKVEVGTIDIKITGNGAIESLKRYEVFSPLAGELKNSHVNEGDIVKKDKVLFRVGSYDIKAPAAGTIITKNYDKGDYIATTSSTGIVKPLVVIADMSKVKFDIPVDELDISKVKVGMEAEVTADALFGETFIGVITKIASEGKNVNGVTTYDVTIEVADYGDLKIGMNVDATITTEEKENVLNIPMSTINKSGSEYYVYVREDNYTDDMKKQLTSAPSTMEDVKGYRKQVIKVGINNKDYIEVLEGLKEGDKVYSISAAKTLTDYMIQNSGGGMMQVNM